MQRVAVGLFVAILSAAALVAGRNQINAWLQQAFLTASGAIEQLLPGHGMDIAEPPPELGPAPAPLWTFAHKQFHSPWRPLVDAAGHIVLTTETELLVLDAQGHEVRRTPLLDGRDARPGAPRRLSDGRLMVPLPEGLAMFTSDASARTLLLTPPPSWRFDGTPVETPDGRLVTMLVEAAAYEPRTALAALDAATGAEHWRFDSGRHRVDWIVPADDGRVYASISDTRWIFERDGKRSAANAAVRAARAPLMIAATGELIYLPADAVDVPPSFASRGAAQQAAGCRPTQMTLARDAQTAYFSCDTTVHAMSADGVLRWSRKLKWLSPWPLTLAPDGGVYAVVDHGLQAFAADGTPGFRVRLARTTALAGGRRMVNGVEISTPPQVAPDGTLYFGTRDDGVYAVAPDGQVRWRYGFSDREGPPPYVTSISFLDGALLVTATGLTVLPAPSARLQEIRGADYREIRY